MTIVQYKNEFLDCIKQDINDNFSEQQKNLNLNLDFFEQQEIKDIFLSLFSTPSTPSIPSIFYIFGAGGVTSWFLPQLIKSLYAYNIKLEKNNCSFPVNFTIFVIDGDTVNLSAVYKSFLIDLEL